MTHSDKTKMVARILKKRLKLGNEEAIHLAYVIVDALDKTDKAGNNEP